MFRPYATLTIGLPKKLCKLSNTVPKFFGVTCMFSSREVYFCHHVVFGYKGNSTKPKKNRP